MRSLEHALADAIDERQYSFVALVTSKWHELGAEAYYYGNCDCCRRGLILIAPHPTAGYLLDADDVNTDCFDVEVVRNSNKMEKLLLAVLSISKSHKDVPFIASSTKPGLFLNLLARYGKQPVKHIRIDEGVGTYLCTEKDWERIAYAETGHRNGVALKALKKRLGKQDCLESQEFLLFDKHGNVNNSVAQAYERALMTKEPRGHDEFEGNDVVICTGPYREYGIISNEAYFSILNAVRKCCSDLGLRVVVKPHPRELHLDTYEALGFSFVKDSKASFEELLAGAANPPQCVLGFSSTALVTASVIFNVPVVCIEYLLQNDGELDDHFASVKRYQDFFKQYVLFPRTIDELGKALCNGLSKHRGERH